MAGGYPYDDSICNAQDINANTAASYATSLTAAGSANTPSAWSQLVASLGADCSQIAISNLFFVNGAEVDMALDIGVGSAGNEVVVVPSVTAFGGHGFIKYHGDTFIMPLQIKAGTRVAARYSYGASNPGTVNPHLIAFDSAFTSQEGVAGYDAIGFQSASTNGTAITASATANTLGSWTQLTASTSRDYCGFFFCLDDNGSAGSFGTDSTFLINIGIGGGGSERTIVPNWIVTVGGGTVWKGMFSQFISIQIPAGTRIAAQSQCSAASSAPLGLTLYGAYK